MSIEWPDLTFPPVNLWNAPKIGKYFRKEDFIVSDTELELVKASGEFFRYSDTTYDGSDVVVEGYIYLGAIYITDVKEIIKNVEC